jgi:hypothetical protein
MPAWLFFDADAGGLQIGGIHQREGMGPRGGPLDQRGAQTVVDLPKAASAQAGAELVEHEGVGNSLAMG